MIFKLRVNVKQSFVTFCLGYNIVLLHRNEVEELNASDSGLDRSLLTLDPKTSISSHISAYIDTILYQVVVKSHLPPLVLGKKFLPD